MIFGFWANSLIVAASFPSRNYAPSSRPASSQETGEYWCVRIGPNVTEEGNGAPSEGL